MSNQLLPCPFCGAEPAPFWNGVGCVTAKCAMAGLHISIEAWNRRAAQPAAGEPVAEFFVDFDTLRKALSIYGLAAPVSNEELGLQMDRQAVRVIEAVARLPFPYPPAAAHGDDAVRADAEAAYVEMTCQPVLIDGAHHYYLSSERMQAFDRLFSIDVSNAAMRAQGDGEVQ